MKSQLQLYVKHEPLARFFCVSFYFLNFNFAFFFFFSGTCAVIISLLRIPEPCSLLIMMELQSMAKGSPT